MPRKIVAFEADVYGLVFSRTMADFNLIATLIKTRGRTKERLEYQQMLEKMIRALEAARDEQ